jgi:hypothetical protein
LKSIKVRKSVAEQHDFYAAVDPGRKNDAAPAPTPIFSAYTLFKMQKFTYFDDVPAPARETMRL